MNYRPIYDISIGSFALNTRNNNRLVELSVSAKLDVPVNECRMVLPRLKDMRFETGMPVSVKLGYDKQTSQVFAGELDQIEHNAETVTLTASGAFHRMVSNRVNLYFDGPSAGEIATELCQQHKVTPGNVGTGMRFSFYTLGHDRSAYEHLKYLSEQCGFDCYADENDHLVFAQPAPQTTHPFGYGENILNLQLWEEAAPDTTWEVYGESPSSTGQGPQGASWLTKKEVKGSAGLGAGVVRRVFAPTIRTIDNATLMAQALQNDRKGRIKGILHTLGAPEVKIGDSIQIKNMPETQQNGMFKVTGFRHHLHAGSGFISQFNIQKL
ncbi:MAG TPA: hypothetical protein PK228_09295 [Saprospiraceae bacterium]|nr:hypothetical protein [Saprospiraceae bacterium]